MNLFTTFDGSAPGDHVAVETDDGRTFEGELVNVEIKLARESAFLDANALSAEFEREDGHLMKVAQFEDGVSIRTATAAHIDPDTFTDYRNLGGSPGVAGVEVEQADDESEELPAPSTYAEDEFADEEPRENCGECGGEVVHVATRTVNGWINEASAYDSHTFECLGCGRRGQKTDRGDRIGVLAPPEPPEPLA